MSNKRIVKIISFLIVLIFAISAISPVFAAIDVNRDGNTNSVIGKKADTIGTDILGVIQIVAGIAAVALLIVLAIKYMTAAPEGKAEVKKSALIYVVGAALMFGASMILGVIQNWMK